jgi:peptide/nickel transport system ATP-binding protein
MAANDQRRQVTQRPAGEPVLEVDGFNIIYNTDAGPLAAVRDAKLTIRRRESLGLVGESGSGKSTLAMGAIRYLADNGRISSGSVNLLGRDLLNLKPGELRRLWGGQIGIVYQSPLTALTPTIRIGKQLSEIARLHLGMDKQHAREQAMEMLVRVAMPDPENTLERYPHQVSGGMLQRCVIAMALMANPALLIMDEPTTALDVTTQAVVLDLVQDLKDEFDSAILYITHDLGVIAKMCDRVAVMYAGEIVEQASIRQIFADPRHPYTRSLLQCIPRFDQSCAKKPLLTIPGLIARIDELPEGCIFAPRCDYVEERCGSMRPHLREVTPGQLTSCLRTGEMDAIPRIGVSLDHVSGEWSSPGETGTLLDVRDVTKHFPAMQGGLHLKRRDRRLVHAMDATSITIGRGQTLGIVGESGSGKTTLARVITGLEPATSGTVSLKGEVLNPSVERRPRSVLKKIQIVFQNPDSSLNNHRTVGEAIARPLALLGGVRGKELRRRTNEALEAVQLPTRYHDRRPNELSQGERQRVAIARAFAADPDLVICDEPISSLDVSVQGALMNLLLRLQAERGTSYLFISHDLSAVQHLSDLIAVVYLGHVMERGDAAQVLAPPYHPYTEALLSALPAADPDAQQPRIRLPGSVPTPINLPSGCRFHPRCPRWAASRQVVYEPDRRAILVA